MLRLSAGRYVRPAAITLSLLVCSIAVSANQSTTSIVSQSTHTDAVSSVPTSPAGITIVDDSAPGWVWNDMLAYSDPTFRGGGGHAGGPGADGTYTFHGTSVEIFGLAGPSLDMKGRLHKLGRVKITLDGEALDSVPDAPKTASPTVEKLVELSGLTEGDHVLQVEPESGWIAIDYLKVTDPAALAAAKSAAALASFDAERPIRHTVGGTRDPFVQPFTSASPWNTAIGSKAEFAFVPNINTFTGSLMSHAGTTAIYQTTTDNHQAKLLLYKGDLRSMLASGDVLRTGNSPDVEASLRHHSQQTNGTSSNFYSTAAVSQSVAWTPPSHIRDITADWTNTIYIPWHIAAQANDPDGYTAIMQPNGVILECYNTVVCANGDIICSMASFTDPESDGTGYQNGRMASLIPNYAGKIRSGEITARVIPHALSITAPVGMLAQSYVWPASAFDVHDGYSGSVPMGSLLAISTTTDITKLGLSPKGLIIARAAQNYGAYVIGKSDTGIAIQAESGATDADYPGSDADATIIAHNLMLVSNNSPTTIGGGGTPRVAAVAEVQ